jgi:hypothetical protein
MNILHKYIGVGWGGVDREKMEEVTDVTKRWVAEDDRLLKFKYVLYNSQA